MISILSIRFDLSGWELLEESEGSLSWKNWMSDTLLLNFFPIPLNIPVELRNLSGLRDFYRDIIRKAGGGLVSVDLLPIKGLSTIKSIFKIPQQPYGMTYLGSLTFPFTNFSYVIKVQCEEQGMTGVRDTAIFVRLLTESKIELDPNNNSAKGWAQDPYDPTCNDPVLHNQGDDEKYDPLFPDHPLSRVRRYLARIEGSIEFADELLRCSS